MEWGLVISDRVFIVIERFVITFKMNNNTNITTDVDSVTWDNTNITTDEESGSWGPEYEKQVDY